MYLDIVPCTTIPYLQLQEIRYTLQLNAGFDQHPSFQVELTCSSQFINWAKINE